MADLVKVSRALSGAVSKLEFGEPVTHVYNPLEYAKHPHELYLSRFGASPKEAVFVGMNPGPFGMGQTGVPFGDVGFVRDWMGIEAPVARPRDEHPKRPVLGFDCERSEVSGSRLWGWAKERFGTPESFFSRGGLRCLSDRARRKTGSGMCHKNETGGRKVCYHHRGFS